MTKIRVDLLDENFELPEEEEYDWVIALEAKKRKVSSLRRVQGEDNHKEKKKTRHRGKQHLSFDDL